MKVCGLILAGGLGRRWGGPKAWARLPDGRCFLEACTEMLQEAGAARVLATLPPRSENPGIEGLEPLVLPEAGLDMFGSLRHGLQRLHAGASCSSVIVLPVDHPLVQASTVRALAESPNAASIATYRGKHGHPLALSAEVAHWIADGRLSGPTLRDVLREVDAVDIDVDDEGVTLNCNTPEVLERGLS